MNSKLSEESKDQFADLSALAASEFRGLVEEDSSLLPEWKTTILTILKEGIPDSLGPLDNLIEEETDAAPDKAYN